MRYRWMATPLGKLVLGCMVALIVLVGLESIARVVKTLKDDFSPAPLNWFRISPQLGWEGQPGFSGEVYGAQRQFGPQGLLAEDEAQLNENNDHRRVVTLGDSRTFGWNVSTADTFAEQLERRLEGVDVINLGMIGYSSYQGKVELARRIEAVQPAVVVAGFDFNDRRFVVPPLEVDGAGYFRSQARLDRLHRGLRHIYLARALAYLIRGKAGREDGVIEVQWTSLDNMIRSPLTGLRVDALPARVPPGEFAKNMEQIAITARKAGAQVVFLKFQDRPSDTEPMQQALALLDGGQPSEAESLLREQMNKGKVYHVVARKYLARALLEQGHADEAERVSQIDHPVCNLDGGEPIYLDIDYNRVLEDTAGRLGVTVLDVSTPMNVQSGVYLDFCHFNAQWHALTAQALEPVVRGLLGELAH